MSFIVIHLSDIHFGQETRRGNKDLYVHQDARERLIDDVHTFAAAIAPKRISGVLVTGDIAYAGTEQEYREAGAWLDRLADAGEFSKSNVQVVPGNHDINWDEISAGAEYLLKQIEDGGEDKLNEYLAKEGDRELLYRRFHAYGAFADAYNCPLDKHGGGAGDRIVELAPGRRLRFSGLNTALTCSKRDTEGKLVLGERQRVLKRNAGEELVVLAHHPMKWLHDHHDANAYINARARVLVTGHEHNPSARVSKVLDDADLLTIEAGATTPPWSDDDYTYTYNILEFSWHEGKDALAVTIYPRCWSESRKEFIEDVTRIDPAAKSVVLACPRYREAPKVTVAQAAALAEDVLPPVIQQETSNAEDGTIDLMPVEYPEIVLRFFRDLSPADRLRLLVEIGAVPDSWNEALPQGYEKALIDRAVQAGKADLIKAKMDEIRKDEGKNG